MTSVRVALGKARWGTHLHLCCKYLRTNTVFHSGSKPLAFTAFLVLKVPKNIANIVVSGDLARQKHRHSQRSVCWMEWQMGKASPYFHFPVVPTIQKNAWYLYYIYSVLKRQERRNCVKTHGCWGSQTSSRQPAKLARASWMTRARVTGVRRAKLYNNYKILETMGSLRVKPSSIGACDIPLLKNLVKWPTMVG